MNKQEKITSLKARAAAAIEAAKENEKQAAKALTKSYFVIRLFGRNIEVTSRRRIANYNKACTQTTAVKMQYARIIGEIEAATEINCLCTC